jgi:hypothetical protein
MLKVDCLQRSANTPRVPSAVSPYDTKRLDSFRTFLARQVKPGTVSEYVKFVKGALDAGNDMQRICSDEFIAIDKDRHKQAALRRFRAFLRDDC